MGHGVLWDSEWGAAIKMPILVAACCGAGHRKELEKGQLQETNYEGLSEARGMARPRAGGTRVGRIQSVRGAGLDRATCVGGCGGEEGRHLSSGWLQLRVSGSGSWSTGVPHTEADTQDGEWSGGGAGDPTFCFKQWYLRCLAGCVELPYNASTQGSSPIDLRTRREKREAPSLPPSTCMFTLRSYTPPALSHT